jgi:hypothetical protein
MKIPWQHVMQTTLRVSAVTMIVTGVYLVYMVAIGIPRTTARNLYNHGYIAYTEGNKEAAEAYWAEAYRSWPEVYIKQALDLN